MESLSTYEKFNILYQISFKSEMNEQHVFKVDQV